MTYPAADPFDAFHRRRRRRLPRWTGPAALGLIVLAIVAMFILRGPQIGVRTSEQKIINVVLPPPPPPPPPPPEPKPPEPKPTIAPPTPTPQTPPPPAQTPPQAQANDALSARVGAGPSNYGLAQGNGGGTVIGGGTGGADAFLAYANFTENEVRRALHEDSKLSSARFRVAFAVEVDSQGRITAVRIVTTTGDAKRDRAVEQRLAGFQLSKRPPDGLPVMRIEVDNGSGA